MNRYTYDEIKVGQSESFTVKITEDMLDSFEKITGDVNPLHNSVDYAVSRGFSGRVCYGMLTSAFLSTLAGVYLPGEKSFIHSVRINYMKPVTIGDTLTVSGTVKEKDERFRIITLKTDIYDDKERKVVRGMMTVGVRDE